MKKSCLMALGIITTSMLMVYMSGCSSSKNGSNSSPPKGTEFTYTVGTIPFRIAIDGTGDVWVSGSNVVTKLNSSGFTIGTYTVGPASEGLWSMAIDSIGNVEVGEGGLGNYNIFKINSSGTLIDSYYSGNSPNDIAIDRGGNIWVVNYGDNTVIELSASGSFIASYTVGNSPYSIVIDASGNVWVANHGDGTVTKLTLSGAYLGTYSAGSNPGFMAIDKDGNVWITNWESSSNIVTELDPSGSIIGAYTVGMWPTFLAIDSANHVWVSNSHSNTVTELDSSGSLITTYTVGSSPLGIAIDSSGNVWTANEHDGTVTEIIGVATGPQYWPYTGPQWP